MKAPGKLPLFVALVVAWLALAAAPAAADSYAFKDKRDISLRSAMDVVSARTGHKRGGILHAVTLERRITPRALDAMDGFVVFLIDSNADWSDIERRVYVFGGRRFHAVVTNGSGRKLIGRAKPFHPSPKTVGAVVTPARLGDPEGYLWLAAAVSNDGDQVDVAPNRTSYVHDLAAPRVTSPLTDDVLSSATGASTADVPFTATLKDTGWSDVRAATVRWRDNGDSAWIDGATKEFTSRRRLDARLDPRHLNISVSIAQGSTVDACVSVADFAGNRSSDGPIIVQVPFDDTNATVFTDVADGTGVAQAGDLGGSHTSFADVGDTLQLTVPAGLDPYLLIASSTPFAITVQVDGGPTVPMTQASVVGNRLDLSAAGDLTSGAAVDITVVTGPLDVDGYLGAPAAAAPAPLDGCGGRPSVPRAVVAGTILLPTPPALRAHRAARRFTGSMAG